MELLSVTINEGVKKRMDIDGKDTSSEDKSNYKIVHTGDMVYNSMRMWQGANGISDYDGIVSPAYTVLKSKGNIHNQYIGFLFKNSELINKFRKNSQGLTSDTWNLKYPQIACIKINIPSLDEQQKIADFLSLVDQRIEKQRQLVESLKKYKRGTFQHIYRNKSINWEKKIVNDFSPVHGGYAFDSKCYNEKGSFNIITIGNVTGKRYISMDCNRIKDIPLDLQEHQYLKNGDIVISMTGNVGRVSLVNADNCLLNQRVAKIVIKDDYLKEYIYQVLASSDFEQEMNNKGQGAAQKNIKNSDIENFIFYIPEDQNKIKEISKVLHCLDTLIEKRDNILSALISTKNGLLQQMFI